MSSTFDEKPRGDPNYDPTCKFQHIYEVLIHNMNYCMLHADRDQTIDESTWGFAGYCGDAGGRLMNKPVSKGKILIMCSLVHVLCC